MRRLVSESVFARKVGYSRARISQLVSAGIIQLIDGMVNPDQAASAIRERVFRPRRLPKLNKLFPEESVPGREGGFPAATPVGKL